jgi:uncharacterized DUF497 family protein
MPQKSSMKNEWDRRKAEANLAEHGVPPRHINEIVLGKSAARTAGMGRLSESSRDSTWSQAFQI